MGIYIMILTFCFLGVVFWLCFLYKNLDETSFHPIAWSILGGILSGFVVYLAFCAIFTLTLSKDSVLRSTQTVYKTVIQDKDDVIDSFYMWKEDGYDDYFFIINDDSKNICKLKSISYDGIVFVNSNKPAKYIIYDNIYKDKFMNATFWLFIGDSHKIEIPDKYIKINYEMKN